jgi:hypothetical protein
MDLSSERKIASTDYFRIEGILSRMVQKLQRSKRKAMYQFLDVDAAMAALYDMDHVYILEEQYLVAYAIIEPWYAKAGTSVLAEQLVLRLAVSGAADFSVVPAFLERKAREAGCTLAVVGTALAKADAALASLYTRHGFKAETTTLTKEPQWEAS